MKDGKHITMAFETSCDETSVAILQDGRQVLSNIIASQIPIHQAFGGVVPEIASRHHLENINLVTDQAMREACIAWDEIDMLAATCGPGLVGALLIGLSTAKTIAYTLGKPLVGVDHRMGHVAANYIQHEGLCPPFTGLIVSGGHTAIVQVEDYNKWKQLGQTRDDAVGEAYDKVARVLGFGYPGGPQVEKAALGGDPKAIHFKRVYLERDQYDFSFSGIKTGVLNYINSEKQAGREVSVADVAASFQEAVLEVLVEKSVRAAVNMGTGKLVLSGGVSANKRLRTMLKDACHKAPLTLYYPTSDLCTDNAAMIGCTAYYKYMEGKRSELDLDAYPSLPTEYDYTKC
ncbi:MAG: tRNA (adenosine(37)-N6)-threonylcarbamoyltransferase complex transferase subunit TsaD [Anaerovoracaceae bacterium]|jgi:N6-L-threonylcarbamoyladenine synthase|nr:tRNA (adenosine(37)-N6)-threonylcarbamoyltransferase complex transferase subunit TsaD [Anaerovoracaceae bacterium]